MPLHAPAPASADTAAAVAKCHARSSRLARRRRAILFVTAGRLGDASSTDQVQPGRGPRSAALAVMSSPCKPSLQLISLNVNGLRDSGEAASPVQPPAPRQVGCRSPPGDTSCQPGRGRGVDRGGPRGPLRQLPGPPAAGATSPCAPGAWQFSSAGQQQHAISDSEVQHCSTDGRIVASGLPSGAVPLHSRLSLGTTHSRDRSSLLQTATCCSACRRTGASSCRVTGACIGSRTGSA